MKEAHLEPPDDDRETLEEIADAMSDILYENWRDERDERSFLDEEHLPHTKKNLKCRLCFGEFIGISTRKLCKTCLTHENKIGDKHGT